MNVELLQLEGALATKYGAADFIEPMFQTDAVLPVILVSQPSIEYLKSMANVPPNAH
jgi:hypothetical protein